MVGSKPLWNRLQQLEEEKVGAIEGGWRLQTAETVSSPPHMLAS